MPEELDPTPDALMRCLQLLSEEAASLYLRRTFAALQEAIATCRDETQGGLAAQAFMVGTGLIH